MDGTVADVQVSVESSWTVLEGSLDSCVSVVFLDADTHEPIATSAPLSSTRLVLVPPAEPVPCEITVKFGGMLCHVQSWYTSSTARIYEIYGQPKLQADPEYVCTVKGWIPCKDDLCVDICTEQNSEDAIMKKGNELLIKRSDGSNDSTQHCSMSTFDSSLPVLNHNVDSEFQNSIYSSGEDSWVDVKLNGSLSAENTYASLMAPALDNWHMPSNVEDQVCVSSLIHESEKTIESDMKPHESSFAGKVFTEQRGQGSGLKIFEAEVELVDHKPWAAVTVRLLSLQDKSAVEVDQMVYLAIGPVPELTGNTGPFNENESTSSSLFSMFLPSMLQMAREVSLNSKVLFESNVVSPSDVQKLKPGVPPGDVNGTPELPGILQELPVSEISKPCPPLLNAVESASFNLNDQVQLQGDGSHSPEVNKAQTVPQISIEPCNQAPKTCVCEGYLGEVIQKELASSFEAFSERFDRLESLCLNIESFLHKTFESLDQRISRLEEEYACVSSKQNSTSQQSSTPLDVPNICRHWNPYPGAMKSIEVEFESTKEDDQNHSVQHHESNFLNTSSILDTTELKGEASASSEFDDTEIYAAKDTPCVHDVIANPTEIENLPEKTSLEIPKLSIEPEATKLKVSVDKLPRFSLDNALSSALSAFVSSFPSAVPDRVGNVVSRSNKESIGSAHNDELISRVHHFKQLVQDRNSLSAGTNNVEDDEAPTLIHWPLESECEEVTSDDRESIAQSGLRILTPTFPIMPGPLMTGHFLDLEELGSPPDKKQAECMRSVDSIEEQQMMPIFQPSHVAVFEPIPFLDLKVERTDGASSPVIGPEAPPSFSPYDTFSYTDLEPMLAAETLANWGSIDGLEARFSQVLESLSEENENGASYLSKTGGELEEVAAFDIFGGSTGHDFPQDKAAPNIHSKSLRLESDNSCSAEVGEENLCTVPFELDLLNGHTLSGHPECSSVAGIQDPEYLRSFMSFITEAASCVPDFLDHSLDHQDGGGGSPESRCFSQDFNSCLDESDDMTWMRAPNVFYTQDPALTDDEEDMSMFERTETADSNVQEDFSDTDSSHNMPFRTTLLGTKKEQQTALTIFPGFENL